MSYSGENKVNSLQVVSDGKFKLNAKLVKISPVLCALVCLKKFARQTKAIHMTGERLHYIFQPTRWWLPFNMVDMDLQMLCFLFTFESRKKMSASVGSLDSRRRNHNGKCRSYVWMRVDFSRASTYP